MIPYSQISKIAFQLGPIKVYWYGITYLVSFAIVWLLAKIRSKKLNYSWNNEIISDFVFYSAVGAIAGGRLGYILFYNFAAFIYNPLILFKIYLGGMSFHGGLIGAIIALFLFSRKVKLSFLETLDFTAPLVSLGLALGRIGNFINGELWGRVTNVHWGMVFPDAGPLPRHPSQLYEAFLEGILLFTIIWIYASKPKPTGTTTGLFLMGYGIIRFVCEFFREPDAHIGFIANHFTLGQLLSLPMIATGGYMIWFCIKKYK